MGLDLVEFVLEAEDRFGIRIPDEEMSKVQTVGAFAALVARLVREAHARGEGSFEHLQGEIAVCWHVDESMVKPDTRLVDLLGPSSRHRARRWRLLASRVAGVPRLEAPRWLSWVLHAASSAIALTSAALFGGQIVLSSDRGRDWPLLVAASLICGLVPFAISTSLRVRWASVLPNRLITVADLYRSIALPQLRSVEFESTVAFEAHVLQRVRQLVAEWFGESIEKVTTETRFVEDLGAG